MSLEYPNKWVYIYRKTYFPIIFSSFQYHICVYLCISVLNDLRENTYHYLTLKIQDHFLVSFTHLVGGQQDYLCFDELFVWSWTSANRARVPFPVSQLWGKCIGVGEKGGAWIFQSKRLTFILYLNSKDRLLSALERQVQGEYTRSYSICGCVEIFMWCSISASNEQQPPRVCDLANLDSVLAIISQGGWRVAGGEGVGTVRAGDSSSSVYQSCHEQFLHGHTNPFHPILLQLHIHLISTRMRVVGFFQWKFQCMCTRVDEFTSFIHSRYNVQSFRQGQMHHLKHSFCLASKDVYNFQMDLFIE